jgi:aminopeptidase N
MRSLPLIIALLVAQTFTPRQREVDMEHLALRVRFDAPKGLVYGLVTHRFRGIRPGVDSLVLDAINLQIESITYHEKPLSYQYDGQKLVLRFPSPIPVGALDSVTIRYTAQPRKGIYFIGWKDRTGRARRQIWTQGQGTDHRYWIPAYDDPNDKLITETYITFDSRYQVLSNGLLLDTLRNPDGTPHLALPNAQTPQPLPPHDRHRRI